MSDTPHNLSEFAHACQAFTCDDPDLSESQNESSRAAWRNSLALQSYIVRDWNLGTAYRDGE